jgi:hypothetical protein
MAEKSKIFNGKKFMWDGYIYGCAEEAKSKQEAYMKAGFEIFTVREKDQYLVYTRKAVKEVVVEGPALA